MFLACNCDFFNQQLFFYLVVFGFTGHFIFTHVCQRGGHCEHCVHWLCWLCRCPCCLRCCCLRCQCLCCRCCLHCCCLNCCCRHAFTVNIAYTHCVNSTVWDRVRIAGEGQSTRVRTCIETVPVCSNPPRAWEVFIAKAHIIKLRASARGNIVEDKNLEHTIAGHQWPGAGVPKIFLISLCLLLSSHSLSY